MPNSHCSSLFFWFIVVVLVHFQVCIYHLSLGLLCIAYCIVADQGARLCRGCRRQHGFLPMAAQLPGARRDRPLTGSRPEDQTRFWPQDPRGIRRDPRPLRLLPLVRVPFERLGMQRRYPKAVPLRSTTAKSAAQALFQAVSRIPKEILSDKGTSFMSRKLHKLHGREGGHVSNQSCQ